MIESAVIASFAKNHDAARDFAWKRNQPKKHEEVNKMLKGIAASQGIAIAKVYKLEQPVLEIVRKDANPEEELAKLDAAFKKTVEDIEKIKEVASKSLAAEELAVFDAHLMMANDPELRGQIEESIKNDAVNAEFATDQVAGMMVSIFESMEDAYIRERAADIKDVTFRLKCNLCGKQIPNLATIDSPVVIIAKDLTPSDTGSLNKEFAKGFATEIGGRTSHSAIMARSLEIPAVVGVTGILEAAKDCSDGGVVVWIKGVKDRLGKLAVSVEGIQKIRHLRAGGIVVDAVIAGIRTQFPEIGSIVVPLTAIVKLHDPASLMIFLPYLLHEGSPELHSFLAGDSLSGKPLAEDGFDFIL